MQGDANGHHVIFAQNAEDVTLCGAGTIDGIRIRNPNHGVNTDGMDITASRNVFVCNCDIETGDDAICLKSENPYGDLLPTKNITITNCVVTTA
jgi:polygalacturonase